MKLPYGDAPFAGSICCARTAGGEGALRGGLVTRRRAIGLLGAGAAGVVGLGGTFLWFRGVGRRQGRLATDLSGMGAAGGVERSPASGAIYDFRKAAAAGLPEMAVARGADPAALVRAAIRELGGMERFVGRGERVLIKPNYAWDRTAEQAANTNPEIVRALIELCLAAGASKVLVGDAPVNDPRRTLDRSGIGAAVQAAGGTVVPARGKDLKDLEVGGENVRTWPFYMSFLDVDRIINVPILKQHGASGLTAGMKNWFGLVGGNRSHLHQKIHTCIVDLASFVRPTLTIVDAFRVLTRNGPSGGSLDDVKLLRTVAASVDPVAADAFGAGLMGWRPQDLESVRLAAARGLGHVTLPKENLREVQV